MGQQDELRERLESELREVLSTSHRISEHLRNEDRTLPKDWADLGQFLENDEVLEALELRSRERVDELHGAIARIEDGTYHTCASCGGKIEEGRLEVLPTTALCAQCAREVKG